MLFFINAYNLKIAGGLNVGLNFLNQLSEYPNDIFYVFAPANCGYEKYQKINVKIFIVPQFLQSYFFRYYLDYVWMKKKVKEINPDVIFSMGNFALPIKNIPQGVLFHYPYLIYPNSNKFKTSILEKLILIFQIWIFKSRLKYVNILFPQTHVAAHRLKNYYSSEIKIFPIPNAYTKLKISSKIINKTFFPKEVGCYYLLCLTKYYKHKNIEVLLSVCNLLKKSKSNIKIIITICPNHHIASKQLLNNINKMKLSDYLINIGPVNIYDVPALYRYTDGLILPTLLESFTATYIDAMNFGKPIFTSFLDFAIEICEEAAFYFDPYNAEDIYNTITAAFINISQIQKKVEIGLKRSKLFPDWEEVCKTYITKLKEMHSQYHQHSEY